MCAKVLCVERRVFSFTYSLLLQLHAVPCGFCVCLTMPSNQTRIEITKLLPIISFAYAKVQVSILLFDFFFSHFIATIIETSQLASQPVVKVMRKNGLFSLLPFSHSPFVPCSLAHSKCLNMSTFERERREETGQMGSGLQRKSKQPTASAASILCALIKTSTI